MSKWVLDVNTCDLCAGRSEIACAIVCSVEALRIDDQQLVIDRELCMECAYCRSECPRGAIQFR